MPPSKRPAVEEDNSSAEPDNDSKKSKTEMRSLPQRAGRASDLSESAISKRLQEEEDAFRMIGEKSKRKSTVKPGPKPKKKGPKKMLYDEGGDDDDDEEEEEEEEDDDDEEDEDEEGEEEEAEEDNDGEEQEEEGEDDQSKTAPFNRRKFSDEEKKAQARERTRLWRLKRKGLSDDTGDEGASSSTDKKRGKRVVIKSEDDLNTSKGATSSSTATGGEEANKKKRDYNHVHESPKQLRFNKPPPIDTEVYIRGPTAKVKSFEWSNNPVKYFEVGAYTAKGERVHKEMIKEAMMHYRIAADDGPKNAPPLYEASAPLHAKGAGAFWYKVPKFKQEGEYTFSFRLEGEEYKRVPPLKYHVTVHHASKAEAGSEAEEKGKVGGPVSKKPSTLIIGAGSSTTAAAFSSSSAAAASASSGSATNASGDGGAASDHGGANKRQQGLEEKMTEQRSSDPGPVFHDAEQKGKLITLMIPGALRRRLCDDWYAVTRRRYLIPMPIKPSAMEVVRAYEKEAIGFKGRPGPPKGAGTELGERLLTLFEGALGHLLLYRFEMEQYVKTIESNSKTALHKLWGAHHLLRLLVIMPRLLTLESAGGGNREWKEKTSQKVPEEVVAVQDFLQGLIDYLLEHQATIFPVHVEAPSNYALDVPRTYRP